ncbi:unnamed protein product [Owenia fusiformis]|uniref:Uncharacterized protein n=1 Tax=Owenia fusiformis TaxID=6347 RepID=A0A8S4PUK6_OWEFU|nr:unnamed protein product [Owenia fusiformis]
MQGSLKLPEIVVSEKLDEPTKEIDSTKDVTNLPILKLNNNKLDKNAVVGRKVKKKHLLKLPNIHDDNHDTDEEEEDDDEEDAATKPHDKHGEDKSPKNQRDSQNDGTERHVKSDNQMTNKVKNDKKEEQRKGTTDKNESTFHKPENDFRNVNPSLIKREIETPQRVSIMFDPAVTVERLPKKIKRKTEKCELCDEYISEIEQLKTRLRNIQYKYEKVVDSKSKLGESLREQVEENKTLNKLSVDQNRQINLFTKRLKDAQDKLAESEETVKTLTDENKNIKNNNEDIQQSRKNYETKISALNHDIQDYKAKISDGLFKLKVVSESKSNTQRELAQMKDWYETLNSKYTKLKDDHFKCSKIKDDYAKLYKELGRKNFEIQCLLARTKSGKTPNSVGALPPAPIMNSGSTFFASPMTRTNTNRAILQGSSPNIIFTGTTATSIPGPGIVRMLKDSNKLYKSLASRSQQPDRVVVFVPAPDFFPVEDCSLLVCLNF